MIAPIVIAIDTNLLVRLMVEDDAAQSYQLGRAELSDYLIGAKSQASGAAPTYTFDRKLKDHDGFVMLRS